MSVNTHFRCWVRQIVDSKCVVHAGCGVNGLYPSLQKSCQFNILQDYVLMARNRSASGAILHLSSVSNMVDMKLRITPPPLLTDILPFAWSSISEFLHRQVYSAHYAPTATGTLDVNVKQSICRRIAAVYALREYWLINVPAAMARNYANGAGLRCIRQY